MTSSTDDIYDMWQAACAAEARPDDAIALLIDAAALGLVAHDFDPGPILQRLQGSFDALMIAKHGGAAFGGHLQ